VQFALTAHFSAGSTRDTAGTRVRCGTQGGIALHDCASFVPSGQACLQRDDGLQKRPASAQVQQATAAELKGCVRPIKALLDRAGGWRGTSYADESSHRRRWPPARSGSSARQKLRSGLCPTGMRWLRSARLRCTSVDFRGFQRPMATNGGVGLGLSRSGATCARCGNDPGACAWQDSRANGASNCSIESVEEEMDRS